MSEICACLANRGPFVCDPWFIDLPVADRFCPLERVHHVPPTRCSDATAAKTGDVYAFARSSAESSPGFASRAAAGR